MKHFASSLLCLFILAGSLSAQNSVAIFDYEDRIGTPDALSGYIQKMIETKIKGTTVDQFSGGAKEDTSKIALGKIDKGGYKLVILLTSDAILLAKHYLKTPSLFANANNPMGLGFASAKAPGGTMSGASYYVPVVKKLTLFEKIMPAMKKVGFVFDDANKSRDIELSESREACKKLGLEFIPALIKDKAELKKTLLDLVDKGADSVVLTTSSVLYANISEIYDIAVSKKVPIFSFHTTGVTNGAVGALGVDYTVLAENELLPMIKAALTGKSPGAMDITFTDTPDVYLNQKAAMDFGLAIPADLIANAKKLIK